LNIIIIIIANIGKAAGFLGAFRKICPELDHLWISLDFAMIFQRAISSALSPGPYPKDQVSVLISTSDRMAQLWVLFSAP
jgi:hypothetical protein